MVGVEPGYIVCGVGGSKRDSTDAEEADAVDPDSLVLVTPEFSSDLDIAFRKLSGLRRRSEGEMCLCDSVGLEIWRTDVGDPRDGAAAIGLWFVVVCAKASRLCS
jgi:hypothetical protein